MSGFAISVNHAEMPARSEYFMRAIILIAGLISYGENILLGQSYIPMVVEGSTRSIYYNLGLGSAGEVVDKIFCDTLINEKWYKTVYQGPTTNAIYGGAIREDTIAQKVFKVDRNSIEEHLFIDFGLNIGDTFRTRIVDTLYYEYLFEVNRKVVLFNNGLKWVEGIGSNYEGAGGYISPVAGDILDFYIDTDVQCFPAGKFSADLAFKVYPNPAHSFIRIELQGLTREGKHVEIINLTGKMVLKKEINHDSDIIALSNFPRGLYVLKIVTSNTFYTRRILVI